MEQALAAPSIIQSPPAPPVVETRAWAVAGLHCAACAHTLRQRLSDTPGVLGARVGYAAGLAVVEASAEVQEALPARLRAEGFRLAPLTPASSEQLRREEARLLLWRLFVAGFCMMQVMMLAAPTYFEAGKELPPDLRQLLNLGSWMLSWPVMLWSAQPFFAGAWRGLRQRRLGMDLPVSLGAIATFVASTLVIFDPSGPWGRDVYFDSLTMFLAFLLAGRWVELKARHGAAVELARLVAEPQQSVNRERADGSVESVALAALGAGDLLRIGLGERLPVDGDLLDGEALLDESLLSGESRPVRRQAGERLVAGSLNLGTPLRLRAAGGVQQGRAAQLAHQLQAALTERPQRDALADRASQVFLAAVLLLALAAGLFWSWWEPSRAFEIVCAVLIVSCPCAFALAAPTARVASHRALARQGLLMQRLEALETLAQVDRVLLDKTGTLTEPVAQARALQPGAEAELPAAAALAAWSRHPMARAVSRLAAGAAPRWQNVEELPGRGLRGRDALGRAWSLVAGPEGLLQFGPDDGPALLAFDIDESLSPAAPRLVRALRELGLRVGLLSGDAPARVQAVASQLGLDAAEGGCSPERKRAAVQAAQAAGDTVLMVGDGLNDAPVLAQADASLAVVGAAPLAARAADALLLQGSLEALPMLIRQARRTRVVMRQNLIWAAAYNLLALPLALMGWLPPWAAGLGMALSSVLVIGNAMRLLR